MKLFSIFIAVAAASCDVGQRKDKDGNCVKKCDLFAVTCSVDDGFSLSVNEDCAANQYSHLDLENDASNFFIGDKSIQASTSEATAASAECQLGGDSVTYPDVLKDLSFKSCGEFDHKSPDGANYTVYNAFINHREKLGDISTSSMDEIEIECRLSHVTLDTKDSNDSSDGLQITANDELDAFATLTSKQLVTALELGLEVGKKEGGTYTALGDNESVDVGSQVTVKLTHATTTYLFALKECRVYATVDNEEVNVALLNQRNNFCPNPDAVELVSLSWDNYISFDINVFRIKNASTLSFACSITVYPAGSTDRVDCKDGTGRRRRNAKTSVTSTEIVKTINVAEDQGSSALKTCANVIIPSVFFMAFL